MPQWPQLAYHGCLYARLLQVPDHVFVTRDCRLVMLQLSQAVQAPPLTSGIDLALQVLQHLLSKTITLTPARSCNLARSTSAFVASMLKNHSSQLRHEGRG